MFGTPRIPPPLYREDWHAARRPSGPCIQEQTPPHSVAGSPQIKVEKTETCFQEHINLPTLRYPSPPYCKSPSSKLPSLREFDRGVEALVRSNACKSLFPSPGSSHNLSIRESTEHVPGSVLSRSPRDRPVRGLTSAYFPSPQMAVNSFGREMFIPSYDQGSLYNDRNYDHSPDDYLASRVPPSSSSHHSPSPEGKTNHINQQYTIEEGDFIIYARHDMGMKWSDIEHAFALQFGHTPKRTVQGLQAWHYRMNKYIPVWDQDGWLCFDNEDDLEPRLTSIKCRSRDKRLKPMALSGIAQRYPERAVIYTWVDPEIKLKSRDWAAKRTLQYEMRRLRRKEDQ